jgi:outer membrane protein OmpA-like peptidoglycan-associated protein
VQGFTDSTGSDELNMKLSQQRAEAVRNVMMEIGVSADRIQAQGLGEGRPVASNKTASGRQQNRRVEVLFSDDQGRFSAL